MFLSVGYLFLVQIYVNCENYHLLPTIPDGSIWLGFMDQADDYRSTAVASGPRGERQLNSRTILR